MELLNIDAEIKNLFLNLTAEEGISFSELLCDSITNSDEELELRIFVSWYVANSLSILESAEAAVQACKLWAQQRPNDIRRTFILYLVKQDQIKVKHFAVRFDEVSKLADENEKDFSNTGELSHLDDCIHNVRILLSNTSKMTNTWVELASRLYDLLQTRVNTAGEKYIDFIHYSTMDGLIHDNHDELLFFFAHRLLDDHDRTGAFKSLAQAIFLLRDPAHLISTNDPRRLLPLGSALALQFRLSSSTADLEDAIEYLSMALIICPPSLTKPFIPRLQLAKCLRIRSDINGSSVDLDRAIEIMSNLATTTVEDYNEKFFLFAYLAEYINVRFRKQGSIGDLDQAIISLGEAIDQKSTHRFWKDTLHLWREERSYLTKPSEDLDYQVKLVQWALDSSSDQRYSIGLCNLLRERSELMGSKDDLDRAIDLATDLAQSEDIKDPQDASYYYHSLAIMLHDRYMQFGTLDDLNHAIDLARKSTDLDPDGNNLNALGGFLAERFKRNQDITDLDQAIDTLKKAINPEKINASLESVAQWKNTLSNLLMQRYIATDLRTDLDSSLKLGKEILESSDNPHRIPLGMYWLSLGRKVLFQATHLGGDLEYATRCLNSALSHLPSGHPYRAEALLGIARSSVAKYARTKSRDDVMVSLPGLIECWHCEAAPLRTRMKAVRQAAILSGGEEACGLLREAVNQIPKLCPRSLPNSDKQSVLEGISGIASDAAYTYLRTGKDIAEALGLLESGRSIMSNILMGMRVDNSELEEKHPDLAAQFKSLTDRLDSIAVSTEASSAVDSLKPGQWEVNSKQRREADKDLTEVVGNIRSKPGFQTFLSTMTRSDFMEAADPDPIIVINMTPYGSDAFLIESHHIQVLHLPHLLMEDVQDELRKLRSGLGSSSYDIRPLLEWLWTSICDPCLKGLGIDGPPKDGNWRRVWWVPTGPLCQLPLHAAGIHEPGSTESVLDRVMSSYAMSVQALRHGQRLHRFTNTEKTNSPALLVSMHNTPGCSRLPYAEKEIEALYNLCPALDLDRNRPECTKSVILEHIRQSLVFHFAGHGVSNPQDPSKSFLLLDDWQTDRLTVADLRELKLQRNPPFLAYLSACSTGSNEKERLADEGVHLVGAFQLAGFRHVIGTLWSVSDQHSADIAKTVYETLQREGMTDRAVCTGLHEAVRKLRHQQLEEARHSRAWKWPVGDATGSKSCWGDQHWVPYVHFGV